MKVKPTCILLTSDHEYLAGCAEAYGRTLFDVRHASRHQRSEKSLPPEVGRLAASGEVDFLFNFLSPMIVPAAVLSAIRGASINFHPGPPEYPGVGSASLALYDRQTAFGVTAHFMTAAVDSGAIIRVLRFPVLADDRCETLFARALNYCLVLFYQVLWELSEKGSAAAGGETWKRKPMTRAQFEKWMIVSATDSVEEIQRKVRAVRHSRFPGPFVIMGGERFELPPRPQE